MNPHQLLRELAELQACFPVGATVIGRGLRGLYRVYSWTLDLCLVLRRDVVLDPNGDRIGAADMVCIPAHLVQPAPGADAWR